MKNKIELMTQDPSDDKYLPQNASINKRVSRVKDDIVHIAEGMDPWMVEFARRYGGGEPKTRVARDLKKADKTIKKFLDSAKGQLLVQYFKLLLDVESGPSEAVRKNMLYEIAVDNQKEDPKEATKAIAELNKMDASKQTNDTGGGINIIIVDSLQRGALDE